LAAPKGGKAVGAAAGLAGGWDPKEKEGVVMVLVGGTGAGWGAVAPKVKDGAEFCAVVGGNGLAGGNAGVTVGGAGVAPNVKLVEGAAMTGGATVGAGVAPKVKGAEDGGWFCFVLSLQRFLDDCTFPKFDLVVSRALLLGTVDAPKLKDGAAVEGGTRLGIVVLDGIAVLAPKEKDGAEVFFTAGTLPLLTVVPNDNAGALLAALFPGPSVPILRLCPIPAVLAGAPNMNEVDAGAATVEELRVDPGPITAVAPTSVLAAPKVNRLSFLFFAGLSCVAAVKSTGAVVAAGVAPNVNPRLGLAVPVVGGLTFVLVVGAADGAGGGAPNWNPFTVVEVVVVVAVLVSGFDLLLVSVLNVNPPITPAATTGAAVAPKWSVSFFPVPPVTAPLLINVTILSFPHPIHLKILSALSAPQDTQFHPSPPNELFDTGDIIPPLSTFTVAVIIGTVDGTTVPSGLAALHDWHWVVPLGLDT